MYRKNRDIVFVDMRGSGGAHPLRCREIERYEARDPWGAMYPPELVAHCAARLSADADLDQYTTTNAVRDLDAVRAAVLTGPVPVARVPPRHHAAAANQALRKLFAACAAQASCHAAFPDPPSALERARAASISDERADVFMERLRTRLPHFPHKPFHTHSLLRVPKC